MNRGQCLQELKQMDRLKDMGVVIHTTSKIAEDIRETKKGGARHFITIPNRFSDLRHIIRTIL